MIDAFSHPDPRASDIPGGGAGHVGYPAGYDLLLGQRDQKAREALRGPRRGNPLGDPQPRPGAGEGTREFGL
jgi:hypothetical protein